TFALTVGGEPHVLPNYFLGQVIRTDPGPLYYPLALAYRLGPVSAAGLIGLLVLLWRRRGDLGGVIGLIGFAALFVALMTLGAKKFDRYMLPALMVLDLIAGVGVWAVLTRLRFRGLALLAFAGLLSA